MIVQSINRQSDAIDVSSYVAAANMNSTVTSQQGVIKFHFKSHKAEMIFDGVYELSLWV